MDRDSVYSIPSNIRVKNLINARIKDIIKCSFESYKEYESYLIECDLREYNNMESYFKYSYGAILILLDNCELSFSSAEDLNSLIARYEKNVDGAEGEQYLMNDIDVLDKTSISQLYPNSGLVNQRVSGVDILTRDNLSPKEKGLPSEVGLRFKLENGYSFILAHNLTKNSFVFSILLDGSKLPENVIIKQSYS